MVLYGWIILLTFALSNRSYMEDRYIIYLHVNKINNKLLSLLEKLHHILELMTVIWVNVVKAKEKLLVVIYGDSINDIPPLRKIIILKENNNIIKEFISIQDAANYVGKHYTCIKNILNGKTKASYSRLNFKYKEAQDG